MSRYAPRYLIAIILTLVASFSASPATAEVSGSYVWEISSEICSFGIIAELSNCSLAADQGGAAIDRFMHDVYEPYCWGESLRCGDLGDEIENMDRLGLCNPSSDTHTFYFPPVWGEGAAEFDSCMQNAINADPTEALHQYTDGLYFEK